LRAAYEGYNLSDCVKGQMTNAWAQGKTSPDSLPDGL